MLSKSNSDQKGYFKNEKHIIACKIADAMLIANSKIKLTLWCETNLLLMHVLKVTYY